jgi:hypothetical protein
MEIFGLQIHVLWVLFHGLLLKLMITVELWTFYTIGLYLYIGIRLIYLSSMKLRDYTEGSMFLLRFQFRLIKFDRKNWRVFYKTLLLLEHLLTHGPLRVADEFQCDKDAIKEMASFQFVDEKGSVELLIDKLIDIQF